MLANARNDVLANARNDVLANAHNDVLANARNDAMLALNVPQAHIIRDSVIICAKRNIILPKGQTSLKKALPRSAFFNSPAYKPGSVVNGHQSSPCVAAKLRNKGFVPPPRCAGQAL